VATVVCTVVEGITRTAALPGLLLPLLALVPALYFIALAIGVSTRRKVDLLLPVTIGLAIPLGLMAQGAFAVGLLPGPAPLPLGLPGVLALLLGPLAAWRSATHMAMTREGPEALAVRRRLYHARRYFERELKQERPDLADAWFPYILAFGLSGALDRWSKAFGGEVGHSPALAGGSSTWSGGGSSGGGWTGGGGQFGGAGASGAWAVAATGLAAGVAPPSSSGGGSGGGGGGGGGGSSGGGGGGGW
jgi:uncharacterized membrane protein YgcG